MDLPVHPNMGWDLTDQCRCVAQNHCEVNRENHENGIQGTKPRSEDELRRRDETRRDETEERTKTIANSIC